MNQSKIAQAIERGQAVLGIELGSTRIKAVLIDEDCFPNLFGFIRCEEVAACT